MTPERMAAYGITTSAITGIGSAYAQKISYDIAAINAKTKAKVAKVQGEADALTMLREFNKSQARDAVMAAAQGRSGGSVSKIANAAEEQLNWDTMFAKLSTGISVDSMLSQSAQMRAAGTQAFIGGSLASISSSAMKTATSLYSIGGSTKDKG